MKSSIRLALIAATFVLSGLSFAQQSQPSPRSSEAGREFDFWVGEWNLTWSGQNKGSNRISFALDSAVIMEQFEGGTSSPLHGMSVSVYNPQKQQWQHTWVDNQGGYLDFTGGFSEGKTILGRKGGSAGREFLQRMVWFNISHDSFDWNWERSDDNGTTWKTNWAIHYTRKT